MGKATLVIVLVVSLAVGWTLGTVLPWWGTVLLVLGGLGYARWRIANGKTS
ncbi:MAG TPA: hypothetical protein VLC10_00705 [Patescibacteria group bacterium]|nr:hypothetical protein [Patescibacteria group bacterium]